MALPAVFDPEAAAESLEFGAALAAEGSNSFVWIVFDSEGSPVRQKCSSHLSTYLNGALRNARPTDVSKDGKLLSMKDLLKNANHIHLHPPAAEMMTCLNNRKQKRSQPKMPSWFPFSKTRYDERAQKLSKDELFTLLDSMFQEMATWTDPSKIDAVHQSLMLKLDEQWSKLIVPSILEESVKFLKDQLLARAAGDGGSQGPQMPPLDLEKGAEHPNQLAVDPDSPVQSPGGAIGGVSRPVGEGSGKGGKRNRSDRSLKAVDANRPPADHWGSMSGGGQASTGSLQPLLKKPNLEPLHVALGEIQAQGSEDVLLMGPDMILSDFVSGQRDVPSMPSTDSLGVSVAAGQLGTGSSEINSMSDIERMHERVARRSGKKPMQQEPDQDQWVLKACAKMRASPAVAFEWPAPQLDDIGGIEASMDALTDSMSHLVTEEYSRVLSQRFPDLMKEL